MIARAAGGVAFFSSLCLASPASLLAAVMAAAQPAPVEPVQQKKVQEYLGNYRQQMVEANKAKAKAKVNEAKKKSP